MVTRSLRADEPRTAPADEIAVRVAQRSAGPIATRAGDRIRLAVTLVHDVAGGGAVGRVGAGAVGDRATDDGAADNACCKACTDRAAIATASAVVGALKLPAASTAAVASANIVFFIEVPSR